MNNFKFRLKNVQKLRQRARDDAAESLRLAELAVRKLNDEVQALMNQMVAQQKLQSQASQGVILTQRMLESQRYQLHLLSDTNSLKEKISLVEQECERRRQTLIQREQEVRSLDRLHQSQLSQWQHVQDVRQQHRLDEWAGFRFWEASNQPTSKLTSDGQPPELQQQDNSPSSNISAANLANDTGA